MRQLFILLSVSLFAGCGEVTWIVLEIESALAVTEEVDELQCWVRDPYDDSQLTTFTIPLSEGDEFPMTILLEPEGDKPNPLRVQLDGRKANQAVASVSFDVTWKANADNFPEPVTLQ